MQQTKTEDLAIDTNLLEKGALILRAINHPLRQQMLRLLHNNKAMAVTSLYLKLKLEQAVASQHLAILRRAGFVNTQREGKQVFYSVNYPRVKSFGAQVSALIENY